MRSHATFTELLAYFVPECSDDPCARRRYTQEHERKGYYPFPHVPYVFA